MEAKELRIGNFLFHKLEKKPYAIETLSVLAQQRDVAICLFGYFPPCTLDFMEPIPLTPEILEKAGFVNKVLHNFSYNLAIGKDGDCISISFYGTWICYIKYLHQLQNLYFALTGEEIPTKL